MDTLYKVVHISKSKFTAKIQKIFHMCKYINFTFEKLNYFTFANYIRYSDLY